METPQTSAIPLSSSFLTECFHLQMKRWRVGGATCDGCRPLHLLKLTHPRTLVFTQPQTRLLRGFLLQKHMWTESPKLFKDQPLNRQVRIFPGETDTS